MYMNNLTPITDATYAALPFSWPLSLPCCCAYDYANARPQKSLRPHQPISKHSHQKPLRSTTIKTRVPLHKARLDDMQS